MHKCVLKLIDGLKNCVKLMKIVTVFFIVLLCLYWMQNLIGTEWDWMNFSVPVLEAFVNAGETINNGSVMLFAAVFEYKYFIAILLFLLLYCVWHVCYLGLNVIEKSYDFGRNQYKKFEEKCFNNQMAKMQTKEQKKLQSYYVYIKAIIKSSNSLKLSNINLDEQENLMNKFVTEQTSVVSVRFEEGFLYEFANFDEIDSILNVFFRVLQSNAPLDYQICVLLREGDREAEMNKLRTLISLGFINKISTFSNVVYRYGFVEHAIHGTSQLGLFQKGNNTFELHEFVKDI